MGGGHDNPELVVACVIGDGEAETGPLATAWHSIKFLDPSTDGAVLPILHLNGYKEEGTTSTPFDMTVLNDLDRFHRVMDTVDRVGRAGKKGAALKRQLQAKLIENKQCIVENGRDLPEIRSWRWRS